MKENLKMYGIMSCGNAISNFLVSLLLVISFSQGWLGRAEANFACAIVIGAISLFIIWRNGYINFDFNWDRIKKLAMWGIPLIPHNCALWIRAGLDQYIIKYNYSTYEVGIFGFALNIASIIITVGSAFNATNSVEIFRILADENKTSKEKITAINRQTKTILMIIVMALGAVIVGIMSIVYFFLPHYLPSIPYFLVLSVYGFIQCLYLLVCNYMFYYGKTKEIMYITFGTSLLHLALSLVFTRYSLYYTALIYVFIQIIIFLLVWRFSSSLVKIKVIGQKVEG